MAASDSICRGYGRGVASGNKRWFWSMATRAWMMHLAEFETAVRYDMPLLSWLLNNSNAGARNITSSPRTRWMPKPR